MGRPIGDVYDWWSHHPVALRALYAFAFMGREARIRRRAVSTLEPRPGERILEIGCGNGNGFPPLRDGVGPDGTVVGLDVSAGMVRSARDRVRKAGWQNVHVLRGDARRPPMEPASFDAIYAAMSVSAVPEPERAIDAAKRVLRPGGRLVVLDARPFEQWPWRVANSLVVPMAEAATNWVPEVDLSSALRREFGSVDVETFNAGSIFVALARKCTDD
ncbi:class I SAM-dependent methyltransferase (plasmid) [Halorientalis pallida]|uniref:class I SAM-dependent methyltransferase n=1 Tax=Halorientalis pallida TaxID=2479928 RepID=UPI003C7039BE